MKYKILFFDADDTLLDFSQGERRALESTFSKHGISVPDGFYGRFSEINRNLWKLLELNKIDRDEIAPRRFKETFAFYDIPYSPCVGIENTYHEALSSQCSVLPYAKEVCRKLSESYDMYILTNGNQSIQKRRLSGSGLSGYFKGVFISDEVGFQKPSREFFSRVLEKIGASDKKEILMIGDSCSSDINGGIFSGIDTCWFNPRNITSTSIISPDYTVSDLRQLLDILT